MKSGENVRAFVLLRIMATSAWTTLKGLRNVVFGRIDRGSVQLRPGDPAPDFELPGSDGRMYRLGDFRGREALVIAWFPKAFTSGCAAECASLESSGASIRQLGVRHFGATMDTPAVNREFVEALGLGYPILSDVDGHAARAFGVLSASGFPSRWTFFIAADGRITAIDKHVRVLSHGPDVVDKLGNPV